MDTATPHGRAAVRELLSQLSDASLQAVAAVLRSAAVLAELRLRGVEPEGDLILPFLLATYLNDTERAVVLALAAGPMKAEPLAAALHLDAPTTQFRDALAGLVSRNVLRVEKAGYVVDPRAVEAAGRHRG